MRRDILNNILILALCIPGLMHAQVVNEILTSPSTKQWVEIFNDTDNSIDLSQYKILDAGAATNGHSISSVDTGGSTLLPAHEYGVVAKDPTSVSASYIFKASLGIKTTGDTVTLKKGSSVVDSTSFSSSVTSGDSLQKFDNGWSESTPTPGALNVLTSPSSGSADTDSGSVERPHVAVERKCGQLRKRCDDDRFHNRLDQCFYRCLKRCDIVLGSLQFRARTE